MKRKIVFEIEVISAIISNEYMKNFDRNHIKLSEILTLIGGGTPKTTNASYWGGPIPWLSVVDFNNDNRYVHTTEKTITEEGVENSSTKILPQGSLILSARGTVGALAQLAKPMAFNQSCYGIIAKEQTTNDFLYYLLKNVVEDLQAKGHGSVFNTITRDTFDTITVDLPSLDEQKRIAEILGSLDDKIELLQKQNKTLEDMAKALFKSWFVDFDVVRAKQKDLPKADIMREYHLTEELYDLFPSSFADSPLGPIPSGWEVKTLKDLASITAGKRPKQVKDIKDDNFFIPVYGGNGIKWWTNVSLYSTPIIITGRVGTLGKVYRIYEPVWVSDNVLIFEVQKEHFEYLLYMLYTIDFNSFNRGSTQPLITQSDIKEILVVFGQDIVQKFHSIIVEYEKKINNNNRQIQTLTELRDALLPRLISGKIRV